MLQELAYVFCLEGIGTYFGKNDYFENFPCLLRLDSDLFFRQFHPGSLPILMSRHVVNIRSEILHIAKQELVLLRPPDFF